MNKHTNIRIKNLKLESQTTLILFKDRHLVKIKKAKLHACRKYNTYQLFTPTSKPNSLYFYDSIVQKYGMDPETHKMKIFLAVRL